VTIILHLKSPYQENDVVLSNKGTILECLNGVLWRLSRTSFLKNIENPKSVR